MNARLIMAVLIGSIISFFLGWIVFGILLHPMYEANTVHCSGMMRNEHDMRLWGVFLTQVGWSALLTYVFGVVGKVRGFSRGFVTGLVIGLCIFPAFNILGWSMMNLMNARMAAIDAIANALVMALIGGIIAVVLGWKEK